MRSVTLFLALVTLLLALVGCYAPRYGDCEILCAATTCPSGLACSAGVCRVPGATGACGSHLGDASLGDVNSGDAAPHDAAPTDTTLSNDGSPLGLWIAPAMVRLPVLACGPMDDPHPVVASRSARRDRRAMAGSNIRGRGGAEAAHHHRL